MFGWVSAVVDLIVSVVVGLEEGSCSCSVEGSSK
jgi:hypothetical protein